MVVNVLRSNKTWGSYRYFRLSHPEVKPVTAAHVCQKVYKIRNLNNLINAINTIKYKKLISYEYLLSKYIMYKIF